MTLVSPRFGRSFSRLHICGISLTPRETDLLIILMQNIGKTLYREYLYESVWGDEGEFDTRTLDTHIQRLRRKLDWNDRIITMYKIGYRLEAKQ